MVLCRSILGLLFKYQKLAGLQQKICILSTSGCANSEIKVSAKSCFLTVLKEDPFFLLSFWCLLAILSVPRLKMYHSHLLAVTTVCTRNFPLHSQTFGKLQGPHTEELAHSVPKILMGFAAWTWRGEMW